MFFFKEGSINKSDDSESESNSDSDDEPDPDMMEQCLNTESCVSKIGYLRSSSSSSSSNVFDRLFAITTTNDFFLWDLTTYDSIYEKKSDKPKNDDKVDPETPPENEDYFFDCFYFNERPIICTANNSGVVKLFSNDSLVYEQKQLEKNDDDDDGFRSHRDVVRGSYWNPLDKCLFTAGEDGFVLKWKLTSSSDLIPPNKSQQLQRDNKKKRRRGEEAVDGVSNKKSKKFLSSKK